MLQLAEGAMWFLLHIHMGFIGDDITRLHAETHAYLLIPGIRNAFIAAESNCDNLLVQTCLYSCEIIGDGITRLHAEMHVYLLIAGFKECLHCC